MGESNIGGGPEGEGTNFPGDGSFEDIGPNPGTKSKESGKYPSKKDTIKRRLDEMLAGLQTKRKILVIGSMILLTNAIQDGFGEAEIELTPEQKAKLEGLKGKIKDYAIQEGLMKPKSDTATND